MAAKNKKTEERELKENEVMPPERLLHDPKVWDQLEGETYGGQSPILVIHPGQIVGPITFNAQNTVKGDDGGEMVQTTGLVDGKTHRLPLSASFTRACQDAALAPGDTFYLQRHEDVEKKKGKGVGQMMAIYELKVTSRKEKPAE